jgi:glutathione peroxidase-family protein
MNRPLEDLALTRIDSSSHPLHDYLGKVLLIVNVASSAA